MVRLNAEVDERRRRALYRVLTYDGTSYTDWLLQQIDEYLDKTDPKWKVRKEKAYSGHTPGHVRDPFIEAIEDANGIITDAFKSEDEARFVIGRLWRCSDIMPSSLCETLEMEPGSTFAQAARKLLSEIKRGEYTWK